MRSLKRLCAACCVLGLYFGANAGLNAAGSPPLITDDPGTPGDGHWELNFGFSTEKRPDTRVSEMPLIDLNYGVGDRWQLKYEVPYLQQKEDGSPDVSGLGKSAVGVKWRFFDAGEKKLSVSVYPQIEFSNPGSNAEDKGLVDHGTIFVLPFQFEQEVGPVTFVWQVGREFSPDEDHWFYGLSAGHQLTERIQIAAELAGGGSAKLSRTELAANLGLVFDLNENTSLLFSVGRELHNHAEAKATFLGYVGVQFRL